MQQNFSEENLRLLSKIDIDKRNQYGDRAVIHSLQAPANGQSPARQRAAAAIASYRPWRDDVNFIWGSAGAAADAKRDQNRADRACVTCQACSFEIPLTDTKRLPKEFSTVCPNCGQREVYLTAQIHAPNADAEATKAPGKIQFGRKATH